MVTFSDLPISIKVKIASFGGDLWYLLSKVDKRFSKYSLSKEGLIFARKIFGINVDELFGSRLTFHQLKDNVTYYAKYMSFYESNCFLLWCGDSFSSKKQSTGQCDDHNIPVIKRDGELHLGETLCSDLKVIHGVIDNWYVSTYEYNQQNFFQTRIPIVEKLPDIYRCYKIKNAPIGFVGYTQDWAFCKDDEELLVNGNYTITPPIFGSSGTFLKIGKNCVYVDSATEFDRCSSCYFGAHREDFVSVEIVADVENH
jgi:hypothetical protein